MNYQELKNNLKNAVLKHIQNDLNIIENELNNVQKMLNSDEEMNIKSIAGKKGRIKGIKIMEELKVVNGKVQLDDGSEIDFKPVFAPQIEYGDWNSDKSITLIKVNLDEEDYEFIKDKPIHYKETNFIEENFWFDLDSFHLAITSNSYLYDRIYNLKFIIVFFSPEKELIKTLNFSNN